MVHLLNEAERSSGRWCPRGRVRERLGRPEVWSSLVQLLKTAAAAIVAWVLSAEVFGLPQSFLAPWSALLVVHVTVYRTLSLGVRQVGGAVLGVVVAWAVGNLLGLSTVAVAVLVVVGLLIGTVRWFREDTTSVAATGLIVLTTGASIHDHVLVVRLLETGIGIGVGLLVNLVVWPPLRDYAASRVIGSIDDAIAALLLEMADRLVGTVTDEDVAAWVGRTRELEASLDGAWASVRQAKESARLNPRRAARDLTTTGGWEQVLTDNEQAVAEARSMAHTVARGIESVVEWEPVFRDRWLPLLREAGEAIIAADPVRIGHVRSALSTLTDDLSTADLSTRHWPEYGALILNLRNIVTVMDRVADHGPLQPHRYTTRRLPSL